MVNHHFAPLILRPRGNRACFIQQFIRSHPFWHLTRWVHAATQCTASTDPPSSGTACLQTSQLSFQTADRTAKHHYRLSTDWTNITAVFPLWNHPSLQCLQTLQTSPTEKMKEGNEAAREKGWDSSTRQGTNGSPSCETLALCRNMLAIWKRQWSTVIKTEQRDRRSVP